MGKSIQLKITAFVHIFVMTTVLAYAAESKDFVAGFESIPFEAFQYVAVVSFAFGSAATLIKVAQRDINLHNLPLEILKDLVCSVAAGVLIFAFGSWMGLTIWPQFVSIALAGFGGPQVLNVALSKGFFPWLSSVLGRFSGPVPPSDPPKP